MAHLSTASRFTGICYLWNAGVWSVTYVEKNCSPSKGWLRTFLYKKQEHEIILLGRGYSEWVWVPMLAKNLRAVYCVLGQLRKRPKNEKIQKYFRCIFVRLKHQQLFVVCCTDVTLLSFPFKYYVRKTRVLTANAEQPSLCSPPTVVRHVQRSVNSFTTFGPFASKE